MVLMNKCVFTSNKKQLPNNNGFSTFKLLPSTKHRLGLTR